MQRLAVRPVFTAHPTEAARRTVLYKLRQHRRAARGRTTRGATARLEETVDLLWQTDELRIASPTWSTRRATPSTTSTACTRDAVPHVLEELADELRRLELELPPNARPLAFGSWIGGDRDGNPNVGPDSTGACSASSTSTGSATRSQWSTCCAATCPHRC